MSEARLARMISQGGERTVLLHGEEDKQEIEYFAEEKPTFRTGPSDDSDFIDMKPGDGITLEGDTNGGFQKAQVTRGGKSVGTVYLATE